MSQGNTDSLRGQGGSGCSGCNTGLSPGAEEGREAEPLCRHEAGRRRLTEPGPDPGSGVKKEPGGVSGNDTVVGSGSFCSSCGADTFTEFRTVINEAHWIVQPCSLDASLMGDCNFENKVIRISDDLTGRKLLDTAIHEMLHAAAPYLVESEVERIGTDLASSLIAFFDSLGDNE